MMPHDDPETWRVDLKQSGLPHEVPLTFDHERWTRDTVIRAETALRRGSRPRRWPYGVLATTAAAAVVALSIVGHPVAQRPPTTQTMPVWDGSGLLSQLNMVTPKVGWATSWQSPSWVMYTSTGLSGFHPVVQVRPRTDATTWTPVGTTSLVVTTSAPGTGMVQVLRISGTGRPVIRTDVAPPGAAGQFVEGWTSWTSSQQGVLYVVTNVAHGRRTWVYRTQSGGRQWQAQTLAASHLPHPSVEGVMTGHVLLVESGGRLYRSTDWGHVFSRAALPAPPGWPGAWSLPSATLLRALGTGPMGVLLVSAHHNAYVYSTGDAGAAWRFQATLPNARSLEFTTWGSHNLWVYSVATGAIWVSTDRGVTWRSLGVPKTFGRLVTQWSLTNVQFASATTGYAGWQRHEVVGSQAGTAFYETVDGGVQWFPVRRFDEATAPVKP